MRQVVRTDATQIAAVLLGTFEGEEREFLLEMIEPELEEGKATLLHHQTETLMDVDDIEAYSNNMSRQQRRMVFLDKLYEALGGST